MSPKRVTSRKIVRKQDKKILSDDDSKTSGIADTPSENDEIESAETDREMARLLEDTSSPTGVERKFVDYTFWKKRFTAATRTVGLISITAVALGLLFIFVEHEFLHSAVKHGEGPETIQPFWWSFIVKDLGVGLIVSGIAVFGFEFGSQTKEATELTIKLNASIAEVERVREALKEKERLIDAIGIVESLHSESAETVLQGTLKELLGSSEDSKKLRENIFNVVRSSKKLKELSTSDSPDYLQVISWLLQKTVVGNARNLYELATKNGTWEYVVPQTAVEMASTLLGAQIKSMQRDDVYDSVSDLMFWRDDQMKYFMQKTTEKLTTGVKVRRIFNLCSLDVPVLDDLKAHRDWHKLMNDIIDSHLNIAANEPGNYEVRFFSTEHISLLKNSRDRNRIPISTFGLFKYKKDNTIIRFEGSGPELSRLELNYCTSGHQDVKLFDEMWEVTEHTSNINPFKKLKETASQSSPPEPPADTAGEPDINLQPRT